MAPIKQKIIPNLWFDREAEDAAHFYASAFKNSRVVDITRASKAGFEQTGLPEGTVMLVDFEVEGYRFVGINGGPIFKLNPSISFLVYCDTREEVDALWAKLSDGGSALMELGGYPHSERYGWIQDKYGVSWQIMLSRNPTSHKITPTLMFVGEHCGKTEEAINFYATVFKDSGVGNILRYGAGMEPDREGTIQFAAFILEGQAFAAMDSAHEHKFNFSEAISLMVLCEDQKEIDYHWDRLISGGGQESVCGWLKDKFGVSWQVAPTILDEMLRDSDKAKVERVTNAFLKMRKFDIAELQKAYDGRQ